MYYTINTPTIHDFSVQYYASVSDIKRTPTLFPPHVHDELELYVLVEGDVSFMVENEIYPMQAGDMLFIRPNELHHCILNSESVHRHLCFWFYPECSFLFDKLKEKNRLARLVSPREDKAEVLSLCEKLATAPRSQEDLQTFSLLLRLIALLDKNAGEDTARDTHPAFPPVLKEILQDIHDNFTQIQSLAYFENKYFLSQSTLNRTFKKYLHVTPLQYIETKKLARSRMLLQSGKSVFDAYTGAGFHDYSNYAKLFKKRFGITPKQYITANIAKK